MKTREPFKGIVIEMGKTKVRSSVHEPRIKEHVTALQKANVPTEHLKSALAAVPKYKHLSPTGVQKLEKQVA